LPLFRRFSGPRPKLRDFYVPERARQAARTKPCIPRLRRHGRFQSMSTHGQHHRARPARLFIMSLTLSDVKRIANLSRLELTDDQAGQTLEKLNGIFALVEQMKAVDTAGVEPLSHPIAAIEPALALRLREDAVTESNRRDDYQQPAPAVQDGLYLVPKVIE